MDDIPGIGGEASTIIVAHISEQIAIARVIDLTHPVMMVIPKVDTI